MNNFTYFAQPLKNICEAGCFVPAFVDKCVEFVETSGKECEKCDHAGACFFFPCECTCHCMSIRVHNRGVKEIIENGNENAIN